MEKFLAQVPQNIGEPRLPIHMVLAPVFFGAVLFLAPVFFWA